MERWSRICSIDLAHRGH